MEQTIMEERFKQIDKMVHIIRQETDDPYLDSLVTVMEILLDYNIDGTSKKDLYHDKIDQHIQEIRAKETDTTVMQKAVQFAILKGMKDATQSQHFMTPESVSLMISYLAEKLFSEHNAIRLFDLACGTGSMLTTVAGNLKEETALYGSEVDMTLLKLAVLNAELAQESIEFFHQDSLEPFLLDPVDLVMADLPVGYYPNDERSSQFTLNAAKGHAYAHHLLIEQGLTYTKAGGYLIFVIPDFLFDSDQSDQLHAFLQEQAHIIGMLRLPENAIRSEKNGKSILILRKKGVNTETPKQPLLVQLPSFKNAAAMNDIIDQMNQWFANYLK